MAGIAITSFALGGIATHVVHSSGNEKSASHEQTLTTDERLTIQEHQAQIEKAKQANLLALEAENKWYDEVTETQKKRAEMKQTEKVMLDRIAAMEAEKLELIKLQDLARTEKQAASDAVVHSIQARSKAEDHALNSYETTLQARELKEKAEADLEKADSLLNKFATLEHDIQEAKKSYAILEAKHQVVLNENNRLAAMTNQLQLQQQQKRQQPEIVVIDNTTTVTEHVHHETIIDNNRGNHNPNPHPHPHRNPVPCTTTKPTPCEPAPIISNKKHRRHK